MSKFIKFTNMLLNTNDIHKIVINTNKYYIYIVGKKIDGFHWMIGGFGLGNISSSTDYDYFEVCKTKHSIDYDILTDWINKN